MAPGFVNRREEDPGDEVEEALPETRYRSFLAPSMCFVICKENGEFLLYLHFLRQFLS